MFDISLCGDDDDGGFDNCGGARPARSDDDAAPRSGEAQSGDDA